MGIREEWEINGEWSLFLDRDGTINNRVDGYIKTWDEFSFLPRVPQSFAQFSAVFGKIFVVTNQQGIDKELMSHEDLRHIHQSMIQVVEYFGGRIDAIYYEPSLAHFEAFGRKPNPGMAYEARKDFPQIDFKKSIMVGDTLSDMQFGKAVGMKTVWIENERERKNRIAILAETDLVVTSLADFINKW